MTTMLERVAMAVLCPDVPARMGNRLSLEEARKVTWELSSPVKRDAAMRKARAAVMELRDPTEGMQSAVAGAVSQAGYADWGLCGMAVTSAIDAVLEEGETT